MAKRRPFIFDTENFHFGQVPRRIGRTLLTLLVYMLLTFTLAVLVYLAFTLVFRTDTERRLRREIRMYERLYPGLEERGELLGDAIANLQHKDNEIYALVFHSSGSPMLDPMEEQHAYRNLDTIPEHRLTGYTRDKADSLLRRSRSVDAAFDRIIKSLSDSSAVLPPMTIPIRGITYPQVGASMGRKMNPFYKAYVYHEGLDLIVTRGTPVLAAADGTVLSASSGKTTGNTVRIATLAAMRPCMPTWRAWASMPGSACGRESGSGPWACPDRPSPRTSTMRCARTASPWIRCGSSSPPSARRNTPTWSICP